LITKFRITANAFDKKGRIGYDTHHIQTQKPFYLSFDLPASLSIRDAIDIPVTVFNNLDEQLQVRFEMMNPDPELAVVLTEAQENDFVSVEAKSNYVQSFRITPQVIKN